jgi:hypothetical protein
VAREPALKIIRRDRDAVTLEKTGSEEVSDAIAMKYIELYYGDVIALHCRRTTKYVFVYYKEKGR